MKAIQTIRLVLVVSLLFVVQMTVVNAQISFSPEKVIAHSEIVLPTTIKAADLTGNGYLDIIVLSEHEQKLSWFKNNGGNDYEKVEPIVSEETMLSGTFRNFYFADFDADGDQDLLVLSGTGLYWLPNEGAGSFDLPQFIIGFAAPPQIVDFNADGYPDIITLISGNIVWLVNDGAGNFAAPQILVSAAPTDFVTTADINGDGFLDLLAGNISLPGSGLSFVWYANDGVGNFGTQQAISIPPYSETKFQAIADLDNDGDLDLVFSYSVYGSELFDHTLNLAWLQNDGTSNFGAPHIIRTYDQPVWYEPSAHHLTDFQIIDYNNNGFLDILYLTVWGGFESFNYSVFSVWYNNGSNLYTTSVNSSIGFSDCIDHTFYAADFDNNGSVDLASAKVQKDHVIVIPTGLPVINLVNTQEAKHIEYFELSDINNDNSLDAVLLSQYQREAVEDVDVYTGDLYWRSNDNSGNFLTNNSIYDYSCDMFNATHKNILCAADFTGDGAIDFVFQEGDGTVMFLENYGGGSFSNGNGSEIDLYTASYSGAHAVDIDNDGDLDLLCYNTIDVDSYTIWYRNDGFGGFSEPDYLYYMPYELYVYDPFLSANLVVDINNDNLPDLISSGNPFFWVANLGDTDFSPFQVEFGPMQLIGYDVFDRKTADLNGDGNIDIIGRNLSGETVWLEGDGNGNFTVPVVIPTITNTIVALKDFDIDGDIDIVVNSNYQISWHANTGDGTFGAALLIANATTGFVYENNMIKLGDIDSDGDWDIAVVCKANGSPANKIVWYENTHLDPGEPLMPVAAFTTFPALTDNPDTLVICQGQPVQFFNQSENSNAFWWDFGNGASSTNANPTYTYPEPGTYNVELTAYNNLPYNCEANAGELVFNNSFPLKVDLTGYNNSPDFATIVIVRDKATNAVIQTFIPPLSEADQFALGDHYLNVTLNQRIIEAYNILLTGAVIDPSEDSFPPPGFTCIDYETFEPCEIINFEADVIFNGDIGLYVIHICAWGGWNGISAAGSYTSNPIVDDPYTLYVGATTCHFSEVSASATLTWHGEFGADVNFCIIDFGIQCCRTITIPDGPPPAEAPRPAGKPSGLSDSTSLVIVVEPGFAPDISCAATVCEGTIAEYSTSADCETYEWTVTGGNLISGQGTPTITVEWTTPPLGSISLSAECGEEYCSMPTIVAIPIIGSSADIQGQTFFCANDVLQYNAPYFGGTQYVWTINPPTAGTILTGQNTNLIAIQWNDAPATLTLSYHNTLLNCGGVGALIVTPKPSFAINPIAPVCEGSTTTVSANSLLPFVWSVSGGEVVSGQNTNTVTILWNVPGTANISILPVNPDDFCNATAQTTATVVPYPQTPAISGAETVCPLQTYIYTASSEQVNTQFVWTVEGGTITAGQNSPTVSVQWNEAPPYLLSVVRQTMTGTVCTSEPAALSPTPLADSPFTVTGNATACPGSLQTYQITPALTGATYTWTVSPPDAALIAQGQGTGQVSVLFGNMPATSLTLSAAYCNLTAELVINIGVLPQPGILQADTLCTGSSIVLSAADLGGGPPYTGYLWKNASNTTISNLPTATINGEGVYSLQVTNESGCTGFTTHRVYQYTSPVAKILTAVNTNICIQFPPEIELYAIDGTNYAFEWTVDDVPVSGSNSPFLTHSGSGIVGNYPYQVLVTDTSNTCSVWSNLVTIHQVDCSGGIAPPDTVIVPPPPPMNCPPVAGFNIDFTLSTTGTDCNTVTLNATTSGDFTGFSVHWGEGSLQPFDGISETHTYSSLQVNIYKITLIGYFIHPVTGQPCFRTLMKTHEVPLAARFDIEPACLSSAWKFQDRSYYLPTTGITQWLWDFGDGTPPLDGTQTEMHTFTNSGTYTATLTISDGNCTVSSSNNYTVAALPNAQFTVSGGECAGNAQNFVPDENSLAAYFWQFGDGNTSGLSNPVYTYAAPGDYAVSLQTLNQQGCYSALQTQSITVAGAPEPQPVTASDTLFCAGLNATLTAPDGGVSYLWSSGQTTPSIIVSTSGNYSVQVTLPSGCVYTSPSVNIQVIPAPSATLSPASPVNICLGSSVTLQAPANENHTYVWSQNDNGLPYNTFINNGIQTVTVTDTITGCTASGSVEIIVHNNPSVPSITASATQLCEGQTADISVTAPSPQNTYLWTTGAAGTAITVNTTGTYGVYAVNSNGCVSDTSFLANINFVALPNAAAFPAGCYAICPGEPITLPQNTAETYQWYFNGLPLDGATGNSIVPQAEGAYWVVMTNSPNCTVTTEVLQLEFSDCTGPLPVSLVSFTGTIQPDGNLLKWTTASELNSAFFTLQFSADGNTFEDLTRLNAAGNSSSARHYESLHGQPYPLAYYRLMQTDFDGSTRQTGNVITLLRPQTTGSFALTHITPTPTQHMATLTYTTPNTQPITLHLYDLTGRLLQHETLQATIGTNNHVLDMTKYPNGLYVVTLNNGVEVVSGKVVKE